MTDDDAGRERTGPERRSLLFAALVVAALLIVAAATAFYASGARDASYAPGSPEAAFQRYAQAWDAGDTDAAYAALSVRAKARVPERDFREAIEWGDDGATRLWIDERSGTDDRVVLRLTVETSHGGLFSVERYRDHPRVTMIREDDAWKIDTPLIGYHSW
jgi:hypothetical protein